MEQDLPDDILTEVFSYLPAKTIGRFRGLSRSWCATLSSASFVQLHRRLANKPGELKLFVSTSGETSEEESYFYSWQPGSRIKKLMPNSFQLPTPLTRPLHGLVLVRCTDDGYFICNPCTGAFLPLPDSKLPSKMIYRSSLQLPYYRLPYYLYVAYGFGYCSVTGEYKAVRIFSTTREDDGVEYNPIICEVFVLDKLAYWRPTAHQPPADCIVKGRNNPGVLLDGHLHFVCHDGAIITFDVTGETFGSLLPPPNPEDSHIKLIELDGCLCVCHGSKGRH